jgi:cyanophycinase
MSPATVRFVASLVLPALLALAACAEKPAGTTPPRSAALEVPSKGNLPGAETGATPTTAGLSIIPARTAGRAVRPLPRSAGRGELILHGGGILTDDVAEAIIARAGPEPRLCLIETYAPGRGDLARYFRRFAGVTLTNLFLDDGNVAAPAVLAALEDCTAHFFNGGDPRVLSTLLRPGGRDTAALEIIRRRFEQDGVLIAGSSAGAMVAGPVTLCECAENSSVQAVLTGRLFKAPGFDFLAAPVLVDAHFFARGLMGRHLFALARDRLPVGVGIDEDGAVLVSSNQQTWRVISDRRVALIFTPPEVSPNKLSNFGLALLAPGDEFDPAKGRIVVQEEGRQPLPASELPADIREAGLNFNVGLPIAYDFEMSDKTLIVTADRSVRAPHWLSGSDGDSIVDAEVSVHPAN